MDKVEVKGLRFHAFHGCHPDEQKVGGKFEVDVELRVAFNGFEREDELESTPDYVKVMDVASAEMHKPRKLIESVAASIGKELKSCFPEVSEVLVTVRKFQPPVNHELEYVSATIKV